MDQSTGTRNHCKVETENGSTNTESESYIKEEIMIEEMTECIDDKISSTGCNTLQVYAIPIVRPHKDESKLTHKQQICNQDENYSTNIESESYVKEEIMIPDMPEYFDGEALSAASSALQTDKIRFGRLDKDEDEKIDVVNVDKRNEKLLVEAHKNKNISLHKDSINIETDNNDENTVRTDECNINIKVDVTSIEETLLPGVTYYSDECKENYEMYTSKCTKEFGSFDVDSNDKDKVTSSKTKCKKCWVKITKLNDSKKPSLVSSKLTPVTINNSKIVLDKNAAKTIPKGIKNKGKIDTIILVCLKCNKRESLLSTRKERPNCRNCKEQMKYECLTCSKQKNTVSNVYCHIDQCQGKRTYQCEQCNYQSNNRYYFCRHMSRQHNEQQECPKCGKKGTQDCIRMHKKICGINVLHLKCKFCPFHTKYKSSLCKHVRDIHKHLKPHQYDGIIKKITEEGEKIKANTVNPPDGPDINLLYRQIDFKKFIQLYCTRCDEICENTDYINERDCRKCGAVTLAQCIKCSKRYQKIGTLYSHLRLKCAARNRYQCAHCDYTSTYKVNLQSHITRRHMAIAPENFYENCSKCKGQFNNRHDRIKHEKHCSKDLQRQPSSLKGKATINSLMPMTRKEKLMVAKLTKTFCPKCNKITKYDKRSKSKCISCGSKITYQCDKCDKVYSEFHKLTIHLIRVHLSDDRKNRQQCLACGKMFAAYRIMRYHQNYCLKQPNLQCAHCHFRTKYRNGIIRHLQRRHGKVIGIEK